MENLTLEQAKQKGFPDGGATYLIDGKEMRVHCDEYHIHSFSCLVAVLKKPLLKVEDVDGKITWVQVLKYYWPDLTMMECSRILWNETCYPFDNEITLQQINELYMSKNNEVPRRNRLDLNAPAELAIYNAIQEVEKVGADVLLTNAIIKLSEAKSLVADFIDGVDYIPPKQSTQDLRTEFDEYMMSGMRPFTPDTVFEWFERKIELLQK